MISIDSVDFADKTFVQISGVINYTALADFRDLLFESIETAASTVLLDMSAVECINADGIQIVLDLYARYSQSHDISIINPSEDVDELLLLTGMNNLMTINNQFHYAGVR